jgi:hypothetical protein
MEGCTVGRLDGSPIAAFRLHRTSKTMAKSLEGIQEEIAMLDRFFLDPRLPNHLRNLRQAAHAQVYQNVAYSQYLSGQMKLARSFLLRSFAVSPTVAKSFRFWSILVKTFLGARLSGKIREWKAASFSKRAAAP